MSSKTRRSVLQGAAALTGAAVLGMPSIVRAQSGPIKIGHLTPLTGFLGAIGGYAQLGVDPVTFKLVEGGIDRRDHLVRARGV